MQCPVCKKTCNQNEIFCSRCSWEFKMFVGGAPPEEEQRLKIAKRNWQQMLSGAASHEKPVTKGDSNKSESLYSENTPVPDLKRDAFETIKEFQKRISDCKPVLAGKAELVKDKYDINTGIFPVKISWKKWVKSVFIEIEKTYIIAERDLASSIYELGHEYPVYALLGTDGEKAAISKIHLYALNQPFMIEMLIFYKNPKYPRRSKLLDSVSKEEARSRFLLDDNWCPEKYVPNEYELFKNGKVVIDHATGLMWQQGGSPKSIRYHDALKYVRRLNSSQFASYSDWRLPTIDELTSLLTKNKQKRWLLGLYIDSIFDKKQTRCWSSDIGSSGLAWYVYFVIGGVIRSLRSNNFVYVRVVRAGQ